MSGEKQLCSIIVIEAGQQQVLLSYVGSSVQSTTNSCLLQYSASLKPPEVTGACKGEARQIAGGCWSEGCEV